MDLGAVEKTVALFERKQVELSETDRNFLFRFACATGDKELTEKLFEELSAEEADKQMVLQKYEVLLGNKPDWIRQVENLLVALEMYLLQNIFITKLTHVIDNDILFYAAVYAGTIVLAWVVHKVDQWLISRIQGPRKDLCA